MRSCCCTLSDTAGSHSSSSPAAHLVLPLLQGGALSRQQQNPAADGDPESKRPWRTTNQVRARPGCVTGAPISTLLGQQQQPCGCVHKCACHCNAWGDSVLLDVRMRPGHLSWRSHAGRGATQVFARCARVQDTTGLANPGISSDVAHTLHKQQGIYGM